MHKHLMVDRSGVAETVANVEVTHLTPQTSSALNTHVLGVSVNGSVPLSIIHAAWPCESEFPSKFHSLPVRSWSGYHDVKGKS